MDPTDDYSLRSDCGSRPSVARLPCGPAGRRTAQSCGAVWGCEVYALTRAGLYGRVCLLIVLLLASVRHEPAPGRLPPMRGRCFRNQMIVSGEALFGSAGQTASFARP